MKTMIIWLIFCVFLSHTCSGFESLGCYYDVLTNRTLNGLDSCDKPEVEDMCNQCNIEHPYCENLQSMTVEFCVDLCRRRGYIFSGLEAGSQCFCGNEFVPDAPIHGKPQSEDLCQTNCTGNALQVCGGDLRIMVYRNDPFANCTTPIEISNGNVTPTAEVYAHNTTVYFGCNQTFYQVGPVDSYCWYSGVFSHTTNAEPMCIKKCLEPPSFGNIEEVSRSIQYPGAFIVGDSITFSCRPGYEPVNDSTFNGTVICRSDRLWTVGLPSCTGVQCGNPGTPSSGMLIGDKFYFPESVEYKCDSGYILRGDINIQCQADMSWSGAVPTCDFVDCGNPPTVLFSSVNYTTGTTYESIYAYTCIDGYILQGNGIITCSATGEWTAMPTCSEVTCNDPGIPTGCDRNAETFMLADELTYYSLTGYIVEGNQTTVKITCLQDGSWSADPPNCPIVDCGEPTDPMGASRDGNIFTFNQTITYTCLDGYNYNQGDTMRTCRADGLWSGVNIFCQIADCGDPGTVNDGTHTYSGSTYGMQVTYACNTGYTLRGSMTRTCQANAIWSGSAASCDIVSCGNPGTPINGIRLGDSETYGSTVTYTCDTGYTLTGAPSIDCQANEMWSAGVPSCPIVDCMNPGTPANAIVRGDVYTYSAVVMYVCAGNFSVASGDSWRMCGADGSWSGIEVNCSALSCDDPGTPEYSMRTGDSYTFGDEANYECLTGYDHVSGDILRSCSNTSDWIGDPIVCSPVLCGDIVVGDGVVKNGFDFTYGGVLTFICNTGYSRVSGDPSRQCQANGTWSGEDFICEMFTTTQVIQTTGSDPQETTETPMNPTTNNQEPPTTNNIDRKTIGTGDDGKSNKISTQSDWLSSYLLYIVGGVSLLLLIILLLGSVCVLSAKKKKVPTATLR